MRSSGQLNNLEEIANIAVVKRDDAPVRVKDIARVLYGKELRTGAATKDGREIVLGTAFMLLGENSREVSQAVADQLTIINKSLPDGVTALALYNRTNLVDKTIATVQKNLFSRC